MKHTITLQELKAHGCSTYTVRDDSTPRGARTVSIDALRVGDKVAIDNYFYVLVYAEPAEPTISQ